MTPRTWLLAVAAIAALAAPTLQAQSPAANTAPARFEVTAIKPSKPGADGSSVQFDGSGRFTTETASLKDLIRFAYQVQEYQITGGPSWIGSDRYDIVAKPELRAPGREQRYQMVQTLLADRFQLKLHRETKESAVYLLVVAKNGPKLHVAENPLHGIQGNRGTITGKGATTSALAAILSRRLGRTVIDRTGLTAAYDFTLAFNPNESQVVDAGANPGPSIFTALQEQLGLKLESGKGPVELLVVDSAEKPGEN